MCKKVKHLLVYIAIWYCLIGIPLIIISILFLVRLNFNPIIGIKSGQVLAIQYSGLINKTYEVSLMLGGFSHGSGSTGKIVHFTANKTQLTILNEALNDNIRVRVSYYCPFFHSALTSSSGCFSTLIKIKNGETK